MDLLFSIYKVPLIFQLFLGNMVRSDIYLFHDIVVLQPGRKGILNIVGQTFIQCVPHIWRKNCWACCL